jgi:hypothetical protein
MGAGAGSSLGSSARALAGPHAGRAARRRRTGRGQPAPRRSRRHADRAVVASHAGRALGTGSRGRHSATEPCQWSDPSPEDTRARRPARHPPHDCPTESPGPGAGARCRDRQPPVDRRQRPALRRREQNRGRSRRAGRDPVPRPVCRPACVGHEPLVQAADKDDRGSSVSRPGRRHLVPARAAGRPPSRRCRGAGPPPLGLSACG